MTRTATMMAALFALAVWGQPAQAAPALVMTLGSIAGGATLTARLNGHDGVFAFDSGGGISTVTPSFAALIGCAPWGQLTGFTMTGHRIDMQRCDATSYVINGRPFTVPIAGVFAINALLPPGSPTLAGTIGLDLFAGRRITIALAAHQIIVESDDSFARRIALAHEIAVRPVRDAQGVALTIDAAVTTPQGLAYMELDTGNLGPIAIGTHLAALLGLNPHTTGPQPAHLRLPSGIEITNQAVVHDMIMDGNISEEVLRHWNLTLDLGAGRAWLAPAVSN